MTNLVFFSWYEHVRVVYGVYRAAVYDFGTGCVYSLNNAAVQVTRLIDANTPLSQFAPPHQAFVYQLCQLHLGEITETPAIPASEGEASGKQHPLTFLWLELTGSCNLGCIHCYAESQNPLLFPGVAKTISDKPLMSVEDWCNIICQGAELGCKHVQFIGGEVLLYRHLLDLIDTAQRNGYWFIEVYTNGTLLTERKVKALVQRNVQLAVSLHGTQADVHDAVTGLPGSFDLTVAGLKRLREHGIPFRLTGTALNSNQHNIIHLSEIATELGSRDVSFDVVRGVGSGTNFELIPDAANVLAQKWLTWPNFVAERPLYEHNRHWNPCWAGKLAITSTGEVMPCVMGRTQVVGDIREETLAAILEKPRLMALWGLTKDQVAVCRDCEYRYACGDCRPLAQSVGDLHGPVPRCTYDPKTGTWGWPNMSLRRQGPAPEEPLPNISLSDTDPHSANHVGKNEPFWCEPHGSKR